MNLLIYPLIAFIATCVNANGNIVTFQELVCQHCNTLYGPSESSPQRTLTGKAGPPGIPGPRGPPGLINEAALREIVLQEMGRKAHDINETVVREIVRQEIEIALEAFRNQSKSETGNVATDGWTVFQRRMDGSVDFNRGWDDYVAGFGNEHGELWLGLGRLYQLTKAGNKELEIKMIAADGRHFIVRYSRFQIGSPATNYRLSLSGYSGNATDSFRNRQNDMQFTTKDSDHDTASSNCAVQRGGGWWFENCYANLNGIFRGRGSQDIRWYDDSTGNYIPMKFTEMKIRRKF